MTSICPGMLPNICVVIKYLVRGERSGIPGFSSEHWFAWVVRVTSYPEHRYAFDSALDGAQVEPRLGCDIRHGSITQVLERVQGIANSL